MEFLSQIKDSIDILEEFRKAIAESDIVVDEIIAGIHKSRVGGQNIEFLDYRDYVYGDDLRFVDWKVFVRSDRYYIKRFDDNKRNTVYIFIDSSLSMNQGEGKKNKFLRALLIAATISNIFLRMKDDVNIIIDGNMLKIGEAIGNPPAQVMSYLYETSKMKSGNFINYYEGIINLVKKNSIVCLFSDLFADSEKVINCIKNMTGAGVFQYLFHTVLLEEINPDIRGLRLFEDPDSAEKLIIQADGIWDDYKKILNEYLRNIDNILKTTGKGKYILCDDKKSIREIILSFLSR